MGKRKEKEKKEKGGERNKERKRGRGASASAPIAAAVGHAWRPGARERDARVEGKQGAEYGCRVFGESKIWRNREVPGKTGVRVSRRDLELNDKAKF